MRKCDWIIFYNDTTGRIGCIPVGSQAVGNQEGTVIKGFYGTEKEAIEEAKKVEASEDYRGLAQFYPKKQVGGRKKKNEKAAAGTATQS